MKRRIGRKKLWGIGTTAVLVLFAVWCVLFPPLWGFQLVNFLVPGATFYVPTHCKVIALTIDDAPDAKTTPQILETLHRHGVRATFFCIGSRIPGNEPILRGMVRQGHEIGNHMAEDNASVRLSVADFERDVRLTDARIRPLSAPQVLRPGQGWYTNDMVAVARRNGYQMTLGSVWPYDTMQSSPSFSAWFIERNVHPGSIIVLHDSKEWGGRTDAVLNRILPELKRQEYEFVTVSELLRRRK